MDINTLIQELGQNPSATARATGLSRMTVQRVRDGASSPTLGTLREFALAGGYDINVSLVPSSDPAAAVAARVMLDPAVRHEIQNDAAVQGDAEDLEQMLDPDVRDWFDRFDRWGRDTPEKIIETAGTYSAPQHRHGARFFRPRSGFTATRMLKMVGLAATSATAKSPQTQYALSGVAVADTYLGRPISPGPILLWLEEAAAVADTLGETLTEVDAYQPGGVVVASTLREYFVDTIQDSNSGMMVVSPIQVAIDLHGLGYTELAESVTEGW